MKVRESMILACRYMRVSWITRNETIIAYALTCSVWLPCSWYSLHYKVVLSATTQYDIFLTAIMENPYRET